MSNTTLDILRPRSHLITVLSDTYIHILHTYYNESMHKSIDQCNWFWIYSCIFFAFSLQYLRNTPLYNFFHKKISYRTFWCIMSLTKKHYRGKWFCTIKTLYNEKTLIGRLRQYFLIYFETFSVPTADSLFLLILSILALESAHSIRFLYHYFLSGITKRSLNVFYYACSYAKVDYSNFMNITARTALKLILIHWKHIRFFYVLMIPWYPSLAKNLKMFQNCLIMLHKMVPTISMDTVL